MGGCTYALYICVSLEITPRSLLARPPMNRSLILRVMDEDVGGGMDGGPGDEGGRGGDWGCIATHLRIVQYAHM